MNVRVQKLKRHIIEILTEEAPMHWGLISDDWESYFSGLVQSTLPRPFSDHSPILLDAGGIRTGPSPFRFEIMWLMVEGFKKMLKQWWQGLNFSGSFSFILAAKLKALKDILKSWNREVFGRVEGRGGRVKFYAE